MNSFRALLAALLVMTFSTAARATTDLPQATTSAAAVGIQPPRQYTATGKGLVGPVLAVLVALAASPLVRRAFRV